ncbi:hypothetical protein, partial [Escherichia coli]|uniref:hypothetical protein n=1 Tax=Escherichia coli TaxID=562 RepID=UPI002264F5E4
GYKNELYFDVSFALKLYQITILHGSGSALSATGNRLGRTPDPPSLQHRRSATTCQPSNCLFRANRLYRGAGAVPGDLKAPG